MSLSKNKFLHQPLNREIRGIIEENQVGQWHYAVTGRNRHGYFCGGIYVFHHMGNSHHGCGWSTQRKLSEVDRITEGLLGFMPGLNSSEDTESSCSD